jgi:hypothetical protein
MKKEKFVRVVEIANVKQNLKMLVDVDPNAVANSTFFIVN